MTDDDRDWLATTLPKAAHKHIDAILDYFDREPELDPDGIRIGRVEVVGARAPVETLVAHGLTIRLDANGNAVTIEFPYGATAIERWDGS